MNDMEKPMDHETRAGSLTDIRVIDFSRVLGGPLAGQILADHGAQVIKVEPPQGDETRDWGPPFADDASAYFLNVNRNKRNVALDLSKPEGREVALRLIKDADVLIENLKPGAMARWGLDYDALHSGNPGLVYVSVTGFGDNGPFGGFPGYDLLAQAWTGLASVNGTLASGPLRLGIPIIDITAGYNAVIGILLALHDRARTGLGQHIDIALYDVGISLLHPHAQNWFLSGEEPTRTGNDHPTVAPYGMFRTKTQPILITVGNPGQLNRLCETLGCPDVLQDPRFATNADRVRNRDALTQRLEAALADRDGIEVATLLMKNGVPAGAVQSVPDALDHAQTRARDMLVELEGYRGLGIPVKLSRTPGSVRTAPARFSADTVAVLREAGLETSEIEALASTAAPATRKTSRY